MNRVFAAVRSSKGRVRANNEDAYFFGGQYRTLEDLDRDTSMNSVFTAEGALFAVCDGVGGQLDGEIASCTAVKELRELRMTLRSLPFEEAIQPWVRRVNNLVCRETQGGGCTLALWYLHEGGIHVAHVGDSRVYRCLNGQLVCLTRDHTRAELLLEAGQLTAQQMQDHPDRHTITRCLGMDEAEAGICVATVEHTLPAAEEGRYLICSDGVTDMLSAEKLTALLQCATPQDCADAILQAAMEAGGRDNITLIVLEVDMPDLLDPEHTLRPWEETPQEWGRFFPETVNSVLDYDPNEDTLDPTTGGPIRAARRMAINPFPEVDDLYDRS